MHHQITKSQQKSDSTESWMFWNVDNIIIISQLSYRCIVPNNLLFVYLWCEIWLEWFVNRLVNSFNIIQKDLLFVCLPFHHNFYDLKFGFMLNISPSHNDNFQIKYAKYDKCITNRWKIIYIFLPFLPDINLPGDLPLKVRMFCEVEKREKKIYFRFCHGNTRMMNKNNI